VGAAAPIGGVAPGSSAWTATDPTDEAVVTSSVQGPGVGIVIWATYDTRSTPGGRTAVASTVEPTRFERRKAVSLSWYNDPAIDRAAKANYDWLPGYLESGGSLFDEEFATRYLKGLEAAFGASLTAPSRYLNSLLIMIPEGFDRSLFGTAGRTFKTGMMYSSTYDSLSSEAFGTYRTHRALGSIVVVRRADIARLSDMGLLTADQESSLRGTSMVTVWNGRLAPTFVLLAENSADAEPLIKQIAALPSL